MSDNETWWRKFPKEDWEYPEGTIVIEYRNAKGEVVMSQPCFAFAKWNLTWGRQPLTEGMNALFGETK